MVEIEIDGVTYRVREGESLLPTCLKLGFRLPYFCWHPALGAVGACRQCAVVQFQDAQDQKGRLAMACMTQVKAGLRIGLEHPRARRFREAVIECLMINHPHDCPVCEEGGECHLQDMTVMAGHVRRRYRGLKRTHRNQDLGPFLNHEMNRCIACYRCLRFYRDYAGGTDLEAFASGYRVYFGRFGDGPLENEFSGNLVEVCPTGVFTDKTFSAHYVRKWDLESAPSLCPHCALGCNTSPGARAGRVRRIVNRYHPKVNGYFLCDRGRFGYEAVNGCPTEPRLDGKPCSGEVALETLRNWLACGPLLGIGSPRASLEANFALKKLVGEENFYLSLDAPDHRLLRQALALIRHSQIKVPAPLECEQSDAILVLGEDLTQTAPRLALALRQAVWRRARARAEALGAPPWQDGVVRDAGVGVELRFPLFLAVPYATRLDEVGSYCFYASPEEIAELALAVARAVAGKVSSAEAAAIAEALTEAENPLVVCGVSCRSQDLLEAAEALVLALAAKRGEAIQTVVVVPECNSLGAALLGGGSLDQALARLTKEASGAIVLEDDLYRRTSRQRLDAVLGKLERLVVIDAWDHPTAARATLFLPATPWVEHAGTWINLEGRAQRFYAVQPPTGARRPAWRWLAAAGAGNWPDLKALTQELAAWLPPLSGLDLSCPGPIPRQLHRYSGRTALYAPEQMHEPPPPQDLDSPLAFTMEGLPWHRQPPPLRPIAWQPGWNSHPSAVIAEGEEEDAGLRLFDAKPPIPSPAVFPEARPAPSEGSGFQVVPRYHLFGSEPLSLRAPAISARAIRPYLGLGPQDAAALGLEAGARVRVSWEEEEFLPVAIVPGLRPGLAALPWGIVPWFAPDLKITLEAG